MHKIQLSSLIVHFKGFLSTYYYFKFNFSFAHNALLCSMAKQHVLGILRKITARRLTILHKFQLSEFSVHLEGFLSSYHCFQLLLTFIFARKALLNSIAKQHLSAILNSASIESLLDSTRFNPQNQLCVSWEFSPLLPFWIWSHIRLVRNALLCSVVKMHAIVFYTNSI